MNINNNDIISIATEDSWTQCEFESDTFELHSQYLDIANVNRQSIGNDPLAEQEVWTLCSVIEPSGRIIFHLLKDNDIMGPEIPRSMMQSHYELIEAFKQALEAVTMGDDDYEMTKYWLEFLYQDEN